VSCCGNPYLEISVQADVGMLALARCTGCGDQQWTRNGAEVGRNEAFELLASAYRGVPLRAREVRDRAAAVTAARLVSRLAEQAAAKADTASTAEADQRTALLDGWQVLGATA
jgi:hypothetical protein